MPQWGYIAAVCILFLLGFWLGRSAK